MTIEIVSTLPEHITELRENLRESDRKEIACFGLPERKAIWRSYKVSILCKTALVDGKVGAIWGIGGCVLDNVGNPWLLTSDLCDKYPLKFAIEYRKEVRRILGLFNVLENMVDASYTKAVKMLEISGFQLSEGVPIGPHKAIFRKFRIEA